MSDTSLNTATIAQLDPLEGELLSGDDSIEITISTRPGESGPGKKSFRTTLNSVLGIYAKRRDNPNQVTAAQVNAFTIEQIQALLEEKLGVDGIAVNSLKLDGATKQEIIQEARAGTAHNADNLGGIAAEDYTTHEEYFDALDGLTQSFTDMATAISSPD